MSDMPRVIPVKAGIHVLINRQSKISNPLIAAEGARTPNLWFRRPTLYPVELQPRLLNTNIAYNAAFNDIIIRIRPCFASKLDGHGRVSVIQLAV